MNGQTSVTQPRLKTRLVRPGRPRIQTTYQLQAELGSKFADLDKAYQGAIAEIVSWSQEKAPNTFPPEANQGVSFLAEDHGQRVECVAIPGHGVWASRLSHPDTGMGEYPAIPGRHWMIDTCLRKLDGKVLFGVNVSCSMMQDDTAPVAFIRPAIVKGLIKHVGLKQVHDISIEPWTISETDELAALEELLLSPVRQMPVIVMTPPDRHRWTFSPNCPSYLIDGLWLAKQTVGYAHVVQLTYTAAFEWTRRVGFQWSVFDGAVRVYMPGLDFNEDALHQHPLSRKDRIWGHKYGEHYGPKAFGDQLFNVIRGMNVQGRWTAPELVNVSQARLLETELNAARMRELTSAKETAFQETLAKLSEVERARIIASETAAHAREMVSSMSETIKALNTRVSALEDAFNTAKAEAEEWSDEAVQAGKDCDYYNNQNASLRSQLNALRINLEAKIGETIDKTIEIPKNYDEMPGWVDQHLTGRLELLPRAVRALKDAMYEEVDLVYKSLLLLANEYRDMRTGMGTQEKFEAGLNALGLKLSGSIDRSRAGAEGDTYFVRYPVGTMKKEFLEFHLRKGKIKDDRLCLAIYFLWHEDSQQVVVGSLPAHLDNQLS